MPRDNKAICLPIYKKSSTAEKYSKIRTKVRFKERGFTKCSIFFFKNVSFVLFLILHYFCLFLSTVNSIWGCCVVGHSITKNEARSSGLYEAKSGKTSADIVNPKGVSQLIANLTFLMYSTYF